MLAERANEVLFLVGVMSVSYTQLDVYKRQDINIDCFWDIFAFAVPFYIATVEYIYKKNTLGRINYD